MHDANEPHLLISVSIFVEFYTYVTAEISRDSNAKILFEMETKALVPLQPEGSYPHMLRQS